MLVNKIYWSRQSTKIFRTVVSHIWEWGPLVKGPYSLEDLD